MKNKELRMDEGTRLVEMVWDAGCQSNKLLADVGPNLTEVKVTIQSVSDDAWYYSCNSCKKGSHEVSSFSIPMMDGHYLNSVQESTSCLKCGGSDFSWNLLLKMTLADQDGNIRNATAFEVCGLIEIIITG